MKERVGLTLRKERTEASEGKIGRAHIRQVMPGASESEGTAEGALPDFCPLKLGP